MSNTNSTLSIQQLQAQIAALQAELNKAKPKVQPMQEIELPGLLPAMWTVATITPKAGAWVIQSIAKAVGETHGQLAESSTDLVRNSVHHVNKTLVEWNVDMEESLDKDGWYNKENSYLDNKAAYKAFLKNKKNNQ